MSKRFGRNQRRKLQERYSIVLEAGMNATALLAAVTEEAKRLTKQLHETQAALIAELGSPYRVATGEELWTIPVDNVRGYRDTSDYKRAGGEFHDVERTVSVDIIQFDMTENLVDELNRRVRRDMVSFRGVRWAVDNIESYPRNGGFASFNSSSVMEFTVHLRAIARSRS